MIGKIYFLNSKKSTDAQYAMVTNRGVVFGRTPEECKLSADKWNSSIVAKFTKSTRYG